jgi:hypothetical protein
VYGWGLRRNEVRHLQLVDFSRNARAPFFGEWGLVRVCHGKAMRGSPAKQRTVLTVFDWAAEALADWAERVASTLRPARQRPVPHREGWAGAPIVRSWVRHWLTPSTGRLLSTQASSPTQSSISPIANF